jgi:hypothetical protein
MHSIRPWLAIGKYRELLQAELLRQQNIGAILHLVEMPPQTVLPALYLPIEDGEPIPHEALRQGIAFIRAQKAAGNRVLVACGAGISRSSTFALAALAEEENIDVFEAYREVLLKHPDALPNPFLFESLCNYREMNLPLLEVVNRMKAIQRTFKA